jgi:pyridoxamine 5'-phosphate oxidase
MPPLRRDSLADDPIEQFGEWFQRAADEVPLAEAMTLATIDPAGSPDARMVLLKGFDREGFRFFTNYESAKAAQLAARSEAALVVYWRELDRQIRIRGEVERLARDSQLGAWASPQSRSLESREQLDEAFAAAARRFEGEDVPRPDHWGGYLLRPRTVEFWQGQVGRLHDRFRYSRSNGGWSVERLAP